jgi:hypothetical protein
VTHAETIAEWLVLAVKPQSRFQHRRAAVRRCLQVIQGLAYRNLGLIEAAILGMGCGQCVEILGSLESRR